jgi:hypothetical protein
MTTFLNIPTELQILIGSYLEFKDFCQLKSSCLRIENSLEQYKVRSASLDVWKKAIQFDKPKVIKGLLHSGIDFIADIQILFVLATGKGKATIVELLLQDPRFDPCVRNNSNRSALYIASKNGYLKIVKLLLTDSRVDPSADDNCAIQVASRRGHHEVVQLLLADTRVDPSANDNYGIRMASKWGHFKVILLLLAHASVDPSVEDNCAIQVASNIAKLFNCY